MPNPIDNEELYDVIVLAGVRSPGKVTLSGHEREVGWDVKKGDGQQGASMTLKEAPPGKFTATFELIKDLGQAIDDFAAWEAFLPVLRSSFAGTTPKALDAYHPDLALNGFKSVVVAKIGGLQHDGKGGAKVAVEFIEYLPPKPKGGSPSGSTAKNPADPKKPDPNQDVLDELNRLVNAYQDTPWGSGATTGGEG